MTCRVTGSVKHITYQYVRVTGSMSTALTNSVRQSHKASCFRILSEKKILNVLYHFFSCLIRFLSPAVEDLINCELSSISVALAYLVVKKKEQVACGGACWL